ncbi:MAG: Wadjet anti-phage system protein JetD domain-containing protein [Bradymonadaceae bacterium]
MDDRKYIADGPGRRWVIADGGATPRGAREFLRHGSRTLRRWSSAGRAAGAGVDQVTAEAMLWALVDAGLVKVRERRNRRGDWEPYQWTLTPAGEAAAILKETPVGVDVEGYLSTPDPAHHEVLQSIRVWLEGVDADPSDMLTRIVVALGREFRRGRFPRARLISVVVGGYTKAVRIADYKERLEKALRIPLDHLVRLHGRSVLAHGPFQFRIAGIDVDARFSTPWIALTPETLARMEDLELDARRILSIENLVAFEETVLQGLDEFDEDTIVVFTSGFPGTLERDFLLRLLSSGADEVLHWGDLDLGGLRIFRHLQEILPVSVRPFRMEPRLLDELVGIPLNDSERAGLVAWLEDEGAPLKELAGAMLEADRKVEQEVWFL